jgi:hypothetical protein
MFFYTCEKKFKSKRPTKKSDIPNLPTGVVVRNKGENRSNFDSLLGLRICYFNMKFLSHDLYDVDHIYENFQGQKIHTK